MDKPMNEAQKEGFLERVNAFSDEEMRMVVNNAPIGMILERISMEMADYQNLLNSVKCLCERIR